MAWKLVRADERDAVTGEWLWNVYGPSDPRDGECHPTVMYEREDDARLIAAAPDLLAALEAVGETVALASTSSFLFRKMIALAPMMEATIAKATGK